MKSQTKRNNKAVKTLAVLCATATLTIGNISASAAQCPVPEEPINTSYLSLNILKDSELKSGNYQGITSDSLYIYQAYNTSKNGKSRLQILRFSNKGGDKKCMTFNGDTYLPSDIQHGNGMTLSVDGRCEYLYITKSKVNNKIGGIVRFRINGDKLEDRTDFELTVSYKENGVRKTKKITPSGVAFKEGRGSYAGILVKQGRGIYDVCLDYAAKNCTVAAKCSRIMTLSDTKDKANIQGIAYDKNTDTLYEFNAYNGTSKDGYLYGGDTYIDAYSLRNKVQTSRKVFSRKANNYSWTELQGMTYTNNKWYFAYMCGVNGGREHFCITTQGNPKDNVSYDLQADQCTIKYNGSKPYVSIPGLTKGTHFEYHIDYNTRTITVWGKKNFSGKFTLKF